YMANLWACSAQAVKEKCKEHEIAVTYETVQAFSEVEDKAAVYYYATWSFDKAETKQAEKNNRKVLIIGSGPIEIGQGMEFDYCSVQGIHALQKAGYETVLINNNPATVSTDYEMA